MIVIISPSKTLDFSTKINTEYSSPDFLKETSDLIQILRKLTKVDISRLMSLSDNLTSLNYMRYASFSTSFTLDNANQAIYAFKGDVYEGLAIDKYSNEDIHYAQAHLRIISGLYGLLRPLDLIQPYRLEMGTKLANSKGNDLYAYWGNSITTKLNELLQLSDTNILVNLASIEYFKAINTKLLHANLITPIFKEKKGGTEKVVALFAKRARGMMSSYIMKNRINTLEGIKEFKQNGYQFDQASSFAQELVFIIGLWTKLFPGALSLFKKIVFQSSIIEF